MNVETPETRERDTSNRRNVPEPVAISRAAFLRVGMRALFFGAVAAAAPLARTEPEKAARGYGTGSYGG